MRSNLRSWLCAAVLLIAPVLRADVTITGMVVDPSGAAVVDAAISVEGPVVLQTKSDVAGRFRLAGVQPGRYRVEVRGGEAFAPLRRDVSIGATPEPFVFQLDLAAIEESVEVNADSVKPSLDTAANLDAVKISGTALDEIPVLDQDFVGALSQYLDPGSVATGGATIMVDGVEVNRAGVPKSAVQEIAINDDPYAAEWQRPGRGRIEIITKPGTGAFHGTVGYTFRNASLASRNYFARSKAPETRQAVEAMLSGPLGAQGDTTLLLTLSEQSDAAVSVVHALTPTGPVDQNFAAPARRSEWMARLTRDLSARHRASIQFNLQRDSRVGGAGGVVLPEAASRASSREFDFFGTVSSTLAPTRLNQFQLTVELNREPTLAMSEAPAIIVRDAFVSGGAQNTLLRTESGGKVSDVMTVSHGEHVIKFGVQVPNINRRVFDDRTNRGGTFVFDTLADYAGGRPSSYTVQQGAGRVSFWWREYGAFVQDQFRVGSNLQVAYGARYDWQVFFHDRNNVSPRLSFAWSPGKDAKAIIRGGAGLFYDRSGVAPVASVLLHDGSTLRSYTILDPPYPDPFANGGSLASTPPNITVLAPAVQIPRQVQYSIGLERPLTRSSAVVLTFRGARGNHLFRSVDINAPLPPDYTAVPDPRFGHIQQLRSDGRMLSEALDITLRGRDGKRLNAQLQYTLGRVRNDTGGIFWYPADQYAAAKAEWGPADFDVRHRLNALITVDASKFGKISASARFASASPYSQTAGVDLFHTALTNARPIGVGRNTLRGASYSSVDVRWSRGIALPGRAKSARALAVSIDAFNVLNHSNFNGYVGNVRSPLYLTPTTVAPGRRIQFGAELKFGD